MEGGGLASVCEERRCNWIVVKAVCDYGYEKDINKESNQKIAATNAAEFIKYVMKTTPADSGDEADEHSPLRLKNKAFLSEWNPNNASRFIYTSKVTEIIGRAAEIAALRSFCESGDSSDKNPVSPFAWWIMTGQGGMGKSRLALELVLEKRADGWLADFLDDQPGDAPTNCELCKSDWRPEQPTLLVIDYAARYEQQLRPLILALHRRQPTFEHPVRVLLIERTLSPEGAGWYQTFIGPPESTQWDLFSCRHGGGDCLDLQGLAPEAARTLVEKAYKAYATALPLLTAAHQTQPAKLDVLLERLQSRPLYILLLADAFLHSADEDALAWDAESLIEYVLRREQNRWKTEFGVTPQDLDVLCLATILGKISLDRTGPELPQCAIDIIASAKSKEFTERYSAMTGFPVSWESSFLSPLLPDLIGEAFVLQHLRKPGTILEQDLAEKRNDIIHCMWIAEHALQTTLFFDRTSQDFTGDKKLLNLLGAVLK